MTSRHPVTAAELARRAGVSPKTFRGWLRELWRSGDERLRDHSLNERFLFDPSTGESLLVDFAGRRSSIDPTRTPASSHKEDWFWEGNVQAALARNLEKQGWRILSAADTASRARGIDLIAERRGRKLAVEVKGFPSTSYTRGEMAGQPKRSRPTTQARHWYAHALLWAARLRSQENEFDQVALAFPDHPRFRRLAEETAWALAQIDLTVYFVREDGSIESTRRRN